MVRLWSEEVGNARSVIEPLIHEISPEAQVHIDGGRGFSNETVEVVVRTSGREARCVVTFEAWEQARSNPSDMKAPLGEIMAELEAGSPAPVYLFTSRGLKREPVAKEPHVLRSMASGEEADALADQFFRKGFRK